MAMNAAKSAACSSVPLVAVLPRNRSLRLPVHAAWALGRSAMRSFRPRSSFIAAWGSYSSACPGSMRIPDDLRSDGAFGVACRSQPFQEIGIYRAFYKNIESDTDHGGGNMVCP